LTVIQINPFEVPEGRDEEFLVHLNEVADQLRRELGFISTKLHKSLDPKARFRFVSVAEWESREKFEKATSKVLNEEYLLNNRKVIPWSNAARYTIIER